MALYEIASEVVMLLAVVVAIFFLVYLLRLIVLDGLQARRPNRRPASRSTAATPPSPFGRRLALLLPGWLSRPQALYPPRVARRTPRRR